MRDLVSCPKCRRLHRQREASCPFCFFARVVTFAAVLPFAIACHSEAKRDPTPAASTSEVSAVVVPSASVATSADPTAVASLTPSAVASVKQAMVGRDGGVDAAMLAAIPRDAGGGVVLDPGLAIPAYGSPGLSAIGAYGGAPSPQGNVSVTLTSQQAGDDRVMAGRRAMFRSCYQTGLRADPTMAGKVELAVAVAADGTAGATVKSVSGLSDPTKQCMVTAVVRAQFEPGAAHSFDATVTATPQK